MKNTTFKKKALLSSVAMLLVAIVALGSATFAWFSASTEATVKSMTANTTQSSNLLVSQDGTTFASDITLANITGKATIAPTSGSLTPCTPGADFDNWQTTKAAKYDAAIAGDSYSGASPGSHYLVTPLYVKYDAAEGSTIDVECTITINEDAALTNSEYFRVALVGRNSEGTYVYGDEKDDFAKDLSKFTAKDAENAEGVYSLVTDINKTIEIGTVTAGTPAEFDVYVWYEGADPDCIDSKSATDFKVDFAFSEA